MSNSHSKKQGREFTGFITRIPGQVSSVIGFLTLIAGAASSLVVWLGGDSKAAVYVVIVVAVVLTWEIALFVLLKKRTSQTYSAKKGKQSQSEYFFSRGNRFFALGAALVLTTGLGWWSLHHSHSQKPPSNRTIIVVADFQSLDGNSYGVTEKLLEQLRESTKEFPDIEVQALKRAISAQDGSEVARAVAKEKNATLVLWGWYVQTRQTALITTHFETIERPHSLRLRKDKQEFRVPANTFDSFQIQIQLSNEMTYLSLLTVGLARFEAGDDSGAIELFNRALTQSFVPDQMIDPANIYFFRGTAFLNSMDYDRAISDLSQALTITPENFCTPCTYNNLGVAYSYKKDFDRAIAELKEGLKRSPASSTLRSNLAYNYELKRDLDLAIAEYSEAIRQDPDALIYALRGSLYIEKEELDKSLADFNEAIRIAPDFAYAFGMRGIAYSKKGEVDKAILDFNFSIQLQGDLAVNLSNRANAYVKKRDFDRALADYNAAIRADPSFHGAFYNRAELYMKQKDYERAIPDLTEVIRLEPTHAEAYHRRGLAFQSLGRNQSAIEDYNAYLRFARDEKSREDAKKHLRDSAFVD